MSSDIYAKPDLSKKVRYNRKVEEDGAEWEEREVNIYESTDCMGDDHTDLQSQEGDHVVSASIFRELTLYNSVVKLCPDETTTTDLSHDDRPQTQKLPPVQTRPYRAAALCVGVLCLLMMAGIIVLSTCYVSVTLEKEQLQTRYNDLNNSIHEKWCPDGWKRVGCSCYFKFTERKTWSESRTDCQSKGADLVIINSKEEQEFVSKLNVNGESWIGLTTKQKTGSTWEWEWVDGSPLTETFWATGQIEDPTYSWSRAACCDQQGKWTQSLYYDSYNGHYIYKNWICEK